MDDLVLIVCCVSLGISVFSFATAMRAKRRVGRLRNPRESVGDLMKRKEKS